jgi:hypothetical protein
MVEKRGIKGLSGTSECTGTKATLYRAGLLMGETERARRATAGSPISRAGKDHLIFNKKWS